MPIMKTVKDFACTSVDRIELCITSKWSLKAPEDQEGTTPLAFRSGFLIFTYGIIVAQKKFRL
jgi:hypothetical protein